MSAGGRDGAGDAFYWILGASEIVEDSVTVQVQTNSYHLRALEASQIF